MFRALRNSALRIEMLIVLFIMTIVIIAQTSAAETATQTQKTTITTTTTEGENPAVTPTPESSKDFLVTKTFGSKAQSGTTGCKTEELSQQIVRDLESQCNVWIKKQKGELKKKYQTGTCEESCNDCGMSLKRCNVTGTVHYAK
jgi:hypothetical protein